MKRSIRYRVLRLAMRLPTPVRRWSVSLTQAPCTVGVSAVLPNQNDEVLLLRHRFREHLGWELHERQTG